MVYPIAKVDPLKAFHGDGPGWQDALREYSQGLRPDGQGGFWFIDEMLVRHLTSSGRIESLAGKPAEQASRRTFGPGGEGANALDFSLGDLADLLPIEGGFLVLDRTYCRIVRLEAIAP